MERCYYTAGSLLLAAMLLVLSMPAGAHAVPGCAGLGGTIAGTECRVTTPVVASGTFSIESTLTLHFVNSGGVVGGITTGGSTLAINVGGGLIMDAGTFINANSTALGCPAAGNVTLTIAGGVTLAPGSQITSDGCKGGAIVITAGADVDINGLVESVGTISGTGAVQPPGGGPITVASTCNLTISSEGVVSSRGRDPGADLINLLGNCKVTINGLVQSTGTGHGVPNNPPNHCATGVRSGKPANSTACIEIVGGQFGVVIDATSPNNGQIDADLKSGAAGTAWVDIFSSGPIQIKGDIAEPFAVHANNRGNMNTGGTITVKSKVDTLTASGLAIQSDGGGSGGARGGTIVAEAALGVKFDESQIVARGDFNAVGGFGFGGHISARSFTKALSWQDAPAGIASTGDVRPVGTDASSSKQGSVLLTACQGVTTAGTSFPVNGSAIPPFPATDPANCSASAPDIPSYITFTDCVCGLPTPFVIHVEKKISCPASDTTTTFTARVSGTGAITGQTFGTISPTQSVDFQVSAGTYTITEDSKTGWSNTDITCAGGVGGVVSVNASNPNPTCTITNVSATCAPGHLIVTKSVCPPDDATLFPISASGTGTVLSQSAPNISSSAPTVDFKVTPGTYSVSETAPGWIQVNGCLNKDVPAGGTVNCTISNTNPSTCQTLPFCNQELAVSVLGPTGRFPGNLGPDVIVDIRKQTLQSAVDNAQDSNHDGYIIIGVIGKDGQVPGGNATQSLDISKQYDKPFAIIGCGVTIQDPDRCDGIAPIHILSTAGSPPNPLQCGGPSLPPCVSLYIQGITAIGSQSSPGWVVDGNGRFLETIGATSDLVGIQITGNGNTLHHSFADNNLGGGVVVQGNGNILDTVEAVGNLGGDGIRVTGNTNTVVNSSAGAQSKGNVGNGITVNGKGNFVGNNTAYGNENDGINVRGGIAASPNVVKGNISGGPLRSNGGAGFVLGGTGNGTTTPIELEGNTAQSNNSGGFLVTGTGHQLKNNLSGGSGSKINFGCQYDVAAGNINATGNFKGSTLIPGADGSPFPTGCQ